MNKNKSMFNQNKNRSRLILVMAGLLVFTLFGCQKINLNQSKVQDNNISVSDQIEPGVVAIIDSDLTVSKPISNDTVFSPIEITGRARVSQGSILFRLKDAWENVIATSTAPAMADVTDWGYYAGKLEFTAPQSHYGSLEVYSQNPQTGEEQNLIKLPVAFKDYTKPKVRIFFNNFKQDPKMKECGRVYPIQREIEFTNQLVVAALGELFKGPTEQDIKDGFSTSLPKEGVKVQKLELKDGKVYIDFSQALQQDIKGTCKTTAILAQITETLKQFPGVSEVVLSIDGKTEGILKP